MDSVGFVTGLTTKFSARTAANTPSTRCARTVPQMGQKSLQNREAREAIVAEVSEGGYKEGIAFWGGRAGVGEGFSCFWEKEGPVNGR